MLHDGKYVLPDTKILAKKVQEIDTKFTAFINLLTKGNKDFDDIKLYINISSIFDVIIRVDKRDTYFHVFHKPKNQISEFKELALECFWLIKLRPFWIGTTKLHSKYNKMVNSITERFCVYYIITFLKEKGVTIDTHFINELKYSFRYRDLSKEALIVLLESYNK